jgi:hypothetical protein
MLVLAAACLLIGALLENAFDPFGGESDGKPATTPTRSAPSPKPERPAKPPSTATPREVETKPRALFRRPRAGRAKGTAWMAGTLAHPRLYVEYVCPDPVDGCRLGLGPTRKAIERTLADIGGEAGAIVEKPVTGRLLLALPWVLVVKHEVVRGTLRERVILRIPAPRLLDDFTRALGEAAAP